MSKFKPLHALLAALAMGGCGMARAVVTEFEPKFSDPAELFDVGDDDPYIYRWVTDPAVIESSSWAFGGVGLTSYSIAAVWMSQSMGIPNSQQTITNGGQPLFAVTAGASAPTGTLPNRCSVRVHIYAQLQATASHLGSSDATAHAEAGSAYLDDTTSNLFDLGVETISVPLYPVTGRQPTVIGYATVSGKNLLARVWNRSDSIPSNNSAFARAEIQYYIVSWTYIYPAQHTTGG